MNRIAKETPSSPVSGVAMDFGAFRLPFAKLNLLDAAPFSGARHFWNARFKEWVGIGFTHPKWYLSVMIQDAKYLGSAVTYLYNREDGRYFERGWTRPGRSVKVAETQWNDVTKASGPGLEMEFVHRLDRGRHEIRISAVSGKDCPSIEADIVLHETIEPGPDRIHPLVVCLPIDEKHFAYTHKAPMPIEGTLRVGGEVIEFDKLRDTANMDEHHAVYPYRTRWTWGSFVGRDADGNIVGVNLADHMFRNQSENNENCVWSRDAIHLLGKTVFEFDGRCPDKPWKISDEDGIVDLEFRPEGSKSEKHNLLFAGIDYYQMFGSFHGVLNIPPAGGCVDPDSRVRHEISGHFGVCENMAVRF